MESKRFFACGKILLTGEYAVLKGATAWAFPTILGQEMFVSEETSAQSGLNWSSTDPDGEWFSAQWSPEGKLQKTTDKKAAQKLFSLLQSAQKINSSFHFSQSTVKCHLQFPRNYGLGSSSSLIALIAQWAQIDPLTLFFESKWGGSGYDVALARENAPIIYRLLHGNSAVKVTEAIPPGKEQLYFLYLGQKSDSAKAVEQYEHKEIDRHGIKRIDQLSLKALRCSDQKAFDEILSEHESVLAEHLERKTIKEERFPDYPELIKSLGAWGGDFILCRIKNPSQMDYFHQKGYEIIISWKEMIGVRV